MPRVITSRMNNEQEQKENDRTRIFVHDLCKLGFVQLS